MLFEIISWIQILIKITLSNIFGTYWTFSPRLNIYTKNRIYILLKNIVDNMLQRRF